MYHVTNTMRSNNYDSYQPTKIITNVWAINVPDFKMVIQSHVCTCATLPAAKRNKHVVNRLPKETNIVVNRQLQVTQKPPERFPL